MATREVGCDEAGGPPWERPAASLGRGINSSAVGLVCRLRSAGGAPAEPPRSRARMAFEVYYPHKPAAVLVYN